MKAPYLIALFLLGITHYKVQAASLTLQSPAFKPNTMIPQQYTCQGTDMSPPLEWTNIPANTQSLALIVQDPDAPGKEWVHWVLLNIPPTLDKLDEATTLPEGASILNNSWGTSNYKGPCPPLGAHRYVFTLYALDKILDVKSNADVDSILFAMTGHLLEKSELIGIYQK